MRGSTLLINIRAETILSISKKNNESDEESVMGCCGLERSVQHGSGIVNNTGSTQQVKQQPWRKGDNLSECNQEP